MLARVDTGIGGEDDYDATMARMDARREAICAETGEAVDPEEYPRGAFGYVYTAYPKVMGLFYNKNADSQGQIYRGCESEAKLLYEWTDGDVRFYLENPEVGRRGRDLAARLSGSLSIRIFFDDLPEKSVHPGGFFRFGMPTVPVGIACRERRGRTCRKMRTCAALFLAAGLLLWPKTALNAAREAMATWAGTSHRRCFPSWY